MPQRFLRPGITTSDGWNAIPWATQSFYIRILTLVDDYGRCDGRPSVLLGQCFSVWNEHNPDQQITLQQVAVFLQQLAVIGLIEIYLCDGKLVVQITRWQERIRENVKERFVLQGVPLNQDEIVQQLAAKRCTLLPSSPSSPPQSSPPPLVLEGVEIPAGKKRNDWNPTQEQIRLGKLFARRETTRWSDDEIKAWKKISPINESDLSEVERFYQQPIPAPEDYRRRDLKTLLNNFTGELDRARNWRPKNQKPERDYEHGL